MSKSAYAQQSEMSRQRSAVYGLLADLFRQEISYDLLEQVKAPAFAGVLAGLGATEMIDFLQKPSEGMLDDLAVEYTRLFLGPGKHVSPHESVQLPRQDSDWGKLWGAATVEVKKFIESTGLSYADSFKGLPDHIAAELEFMQQVTQAGAEAFSEENMEKAQYMQSIAEQFLKDHLGRWIPLFCEKVREAAELPFYRELADLTEKFVAFDRKIKNE